MSFPEINFALQTVFLVVVLVSMAFRMKGNYLVHGVTMIVAVAAELIGFFATLGLTAGSSTQYLISPSLHLGVFGTHAFFGLSTFISGIWLVALWRPQSTTFPAKSKRIAQATTILWVSSYVVGLILFVVLNTTLFA